MRGICRSVPVLRPSCGRTVRIARRKLHPALPLRRFLLQRVPAFFKRHVKFAQEVIFSILPTAISSSLYSSSAVNFSSTISLKYFPANRLRQIPNRSARIFVGTDDVAARQNRFDNRRISAWTADTLFFQRLDE